VVIVGLDAAGVEQRLAVGELVCSECSARLTGWRPTATVRGWLRRASRIQPGTALRYQ
jgi:hypothetical protein